MFLVPETTVRSLPSDKSFLQWDITASYNSTVNNASTQLQLLFRTRQADAVIFMASSFSTLERIMLEVGFVYSSLDFEFSCSGAHAREIANVSLLRDKYLPKPHYATDFNSLPN